MRLINRSTLALFIVFVAVAVGLSTPFFLEQGILDKLDVGVGLISGISTIITLLIALLLFNRFGLEGEVLSKQGDIVFNLMRELKKVRFSLSMHSSGVLFFTPCDYAEIKERGLFDSYFDHKLLFAGKYMETIKPIEGLMNDVFMPLSIKEKLKPVCAMSIMSYHPLEEGYLSVCADFTSNKKKKEKTKKKDGVSIGIPEGFQGRFNEKDMKFREFADYWEAAIVETKTWLQQRSIHHEINL